ncbi:hypothetical protein HDU89_004855 [Geranomyces variabilis]|nr:hypothetical protein HDU89_004855 [Geranomyces variabilis]
MDGRELRASRSENAYAPALQRSLRKGSMLAPPVATPRVLYEGPDGLENGHEQVAPRALGHIMLPYWYGDAG